MGGMNLTITAFQVDFGDGPKEYLTCVDVERLNKGRGIPVEALIGVVLQSRENPDDSIAPDNFRANMAFMNLLQGLMAENGEWMDDMRINASALGTGVLYVIDERSPKPVEGQEWIVRSDDLIGEFDVKDGEIVPGSYRRNPDFALVNEEGLFQLTDGIAKTVMVAIENLPDPDDPTPSWGFERIN
jgi:hypothetical protein